MLRRRALLTGLSFGEIMRASPLQASVLSTPIEAVGNWRSDLTADILAVLERARSACLEAMTLVSDRQPVNLRVDEHVTGSPAIWLHSDQPTTAWIIVDIGPHDWCKLAYQFGHELGHVLANSWQWGATPANPCQWLEEAIVESFSLRGLSRLALSWEANPPFPNDQAFGAAIRDYRDNVLRESAALGVKQHMEQGFTAWFRENRPFLETHGGVNDARAAVPLLYSWFEADPGIVTDIGALNRWPGRTSIPLPDYLAAWTASCAELGAPGRLPAALKQSLEV